jgi:putative ABC transport system substrate-binding protein
MYRGFASSMSYGRLPSILVVSALLFSAVTSLNAEDSYLIINSDANVQKYKAVQQAFIESVDARTTELDLASTKPERATSLIRSTNPSLIYCIGSKAYLTIKDATKSRKVVVSSAINWQRFRLGKQTFGVANELNTGMQLTMFKYFFPEIKTIGVIYSKTYNRQWLSKAKDSAKDVGIEIEARSVRRAKDVGKALDKILPKVDALWLITDPVALGDAASIETIFRIADSRRKPIFTYSAAFVTDKFSPAMVISPDIPTIGRQAAGLADEVMADEEIEEKFQDPAGSAITLNMKVVEKYKLKLNEDALDSVNQLIK